MPLHGQWRAGRCGEDGSLGEGTGGTTLGVIVMACILVVEADGDE